MNIKITSDVVEAMANEVYDMIWDKKHVDIATIYLLANENAYYHLGSIGINVPSHLVNAIVERVVWYREN